MDQRRRAWQATLGRDLTGICNDFQRTCSLKYAGITWQRCAEKKESVSVNLASLLRVQNENGRYYDGTVLLILQVVQVQ